MYISNSSDQTNEAVFILDRDQPAPPRQRPNTPPPNYNIFNPMQLTITYEIIKTEDLHVVLVHEQPLVNAINAENEQGVIRRFTTDNPVILDDEFVSPIRRFNQADQYSPHYIFGSPMSPYSSSEGYCSGAIGKQIPHGDPTTQCATTYPLFSTLQSGIYPNSFSQTRQRNEAEDCHSPSQDVRPVT